MYFNGLHHEIKKKIKKESAFCTYKKPFAIIAIIFIRKSNDMLTISAFVYPQRLKLSDTCILWHDAFNYISLL